MFPLTFALDLHRILFVLTFGLTHRDCMFPLAFVNTSQDWLILQISLASLRVSHMASHWRMIVDATKFNTYMIESSGNVVTCNPANLGILKTIKSVEF
jgi:ABC-type glycerol-3-phosphate transport system permease component